MTSGNGPASTAKVPPEIRPEPKRREPDSEPEETPDYDPAVPNHLVSITSAQNGQLFAATVSGKVYRYVRGAGLNAPKWTPVPPVPDTPAADDNE